ncbi:unnamed protein product [Prorocentrum cordatum]|uniref:Uncharacterized protein n=1 Tax=Prorocentrum cordatum TaxID=2364126 RepID=A0ABN9Y0A0_9DINO|nr:unnamed protein product [Polarella glacialis]
MVPAPFPHAPWVKPQVDGEGWSIARGRRGQAQVSSFACPSCGCKKSSVNASHCKHCAHPLPRLFHGDGPPAGGRWAAAGPPGFWYGNGFSGKGPVFQNFGGKGGGRGPSGKGKGKGYFGGDQTMWDVLAHQGDARAGGAGGGTPPLPVGPAPAITAAEAKALGESLQKAGDVGAAAKYLDMAKHLEAAAKPVVVSDHTRRQQAHSMVRKLEKQMEQQLGRVTRLREQLVEAEASLRSLRVHLDQADLDYKQTLAALQGPPQPTEERTQSISFKLEDLVAGDVDFAKIIDCSHMLEDLTTDNDVDVADLEQFQKRKEDLSSGVTKLARDLFAQVASHAKALREQHEAHRLRDAAAAAGAGAGAPSEGAKAAASAAGAAEAGQASAAPQEDIRAKKQYCVKAGEALREGSPVARLPQSDAIFPGASSARAWSCMRPVPDDERLPVTSAPTPAAQGAADGCIRLDEGLLVTTVNANSWGTLKNFLSSASSHVVIAQEHRLKDPCALDQASKSSKFLGWKTLEEAYLREFASVFEMALGFSKLLGMLFSFLVELSPPWFTFQGEAGRQVLNSILQPPSAVAVQESSEFHSLFKASAALARCAFSPVLDPELGSDLDDLIDQVAQAVAAAKALHRAITATLECKLAMDKVGMISNSPDVSRKLTETLGPPVGPACSRVTNLGSDFTSGRPVRSKGRSAKLKSRAAATLRKTKKLKGFQQVLGRKCLKVFAAGPMAGAVYGSDLFGISDRELLNLRRMAMSTVEPRAQGRSLSVLCLLSDDPTWRGCCAPVIRWAKEVWTLHTHGFPWTLSWAELRDGWSAVSASDDHSWSKVAGPISALRVTWYRLGWTMPNFCTFVDDFGREISLTLSSPKLACCEEPRLPVALRSSGELEDNGLKMPRRLILEYVQLLKDNPAANVMDRLSLYKRAIWTVARRLEQSSNIAPSTLDMEDRLGVALKLIRAIEQGKLSAISDCIQACPELKDYVRNPYAIEGNLTRKLEDLRNFAADLARQHALDELTKSREVLQGTDEFKASRARQRNTRLIFRLAPGRAGGIGAVQKPSGEVVVDSQGMATALRDHWSEVFQKTGVNRALLEDWLRDDVQHRPSTDLSLPALRLKWVHFLTAIRNSNNSAPGPDGIPFLAWRRCAKFSAQILLDSTRWMGEVGVGGIGEEQLKAMQLTGMPYGLMDIDAAATAAKVRAMMHEASQSGGLNVRSRALYLNSLLSQADSVQKHMLYGHWARNAFVLNLDSAHSAVQMRIGTPTPENALAEFVGFILAKTVNRRMAPDERAALRACAVYALMRTHGSVRADPLRRAAGQLRRCAPSLLTLGALVSGLSAVRFAQEGVFTGAVKCVMLAGVLDGLDGHTARFLGAVSEMGAELDSLCDLANFGVVPALVAYFWAIRLPQEACSSHWTMRCCGRLAARTPAAARCDLRASTSPIGPPRWTSSFSADLPAGGPPFQLVRLGTTTSCRGNCISRASLLLWLQHTLWCL